tara:strand:+ start:51 stop:779 length:729 start_codon:yes stop_codon:yes gene_type:complete
MALTKVIGSGVGELTNKVGLGLSSPAAAFHVQTSTDGTGLSGDDIYVARFHNQEATTSRSFGVDIQAGSSTTDQALRIKDHDGTNTLMIVDGLGHITKPKQSAFNAIASGTQTLSSLNTAVTINFATERFDQNSDFDNTNMVFTAPVTGRYLFTTSLYLFNSLDSAATYYYMDIQTSNETVDVYFETSNILNGDTNGFNFQASSLQDMDAGDTAKVRLYQSGGSAQTQIAAGHTHFSGALIC